MTSSGLRRAARLLALTLAPVFSTLVLASPALAAPIRPRRCRPAGRTMTPPVPPREGSTGSA
ncbi:hypothetical protein P0F65_19000 [Sphingomonas sp. I4]